jgi:hypothetical protein
VPPLPFIRGPPAPATCTFPPPTCTPAAHLQAGSQDPKALHHTHTPTDTPRCYWRLAGYSAGRRGRRRRGHHWQRSRPIIRTSCASSPPQYRQRARVSVRTPAPRHSQAWPGAAGLPQPRPPGKLQRRAGLAGFLNSRCWLGQVCCSLEHKGAAAQAGHCMPCRLRPFQRHAQPRLLPTSCAALAASRWGWPEVGATCMQRAWQRLQPLGIFWAGVHMGRPTAPSSEP